MAETSTASANTWAFGAGENQRCRCRLHRLPLLCRRPADLPTPKREKKRFINSLSAYFPEEREELQRYVEAIFAITDSIDLFNLRPTTDFLQVHTDDFLMAADAFVAKYIQNPKLRSIVSYMNPLYGGRQDETPAFIHAIISTLYIQGTSRFVGGSEHFAQLLVSVIEQAGGKVLTHTEVEWVEVNNRHVEYVRTRQGEIFQGDYFISAIHPCTLLKRMPEKAFPKAYRERLNQIPNSYSAFSVYIKLKPDCFPYINHSEYYMTRYDEIWKFGEQHDTFAFRLPVDDSAGREPGQIQFKSPHHRTYAL